MASETVRIRSETHTKLKQLSVESGQPMPDVLDQAVEALRRQRFLEEANRAFARLRSSSKAWSAEKLERKRWDKTLADGNQDE